jgi:hypothetical protein
MSQIVTSVEDERKNNKEKNAAAELARETESVELKKRLEARRSAGHRKRLLSVKVQL